MNRKNLHIDLGLPPKRFRVIKATSALSLSKGDRYKIVGENGGHPIYKRMGVSPVNIVYDLKTILMALAFGCIEIIK